MAGMDKYLDNFTCPLGMDLFEDPITVPCCGQAMSRKPLTDWLNTQPEKTCPLCTGDLSKFNPTTAQTNKNLLNFVEMVQKEKKNKEKISGKKRNGNNDHDGEPEKKRHKSVLKDDAIQFELKYIFFDDLTTIQSNNIFNYDSRDRGDIDLFLEENISANALLSLWDLGGITTCCINSSFWYKSDTFTKLFDYWEKTHSINKKNQLVYHYSQRHNLTWRPNREIFKQKKGKKTKWPVQEYDVIHQGQCKSFILFDKQKIHRLKCNGLDKHNAKEKKEDDSHSIWENPNEKLLILKYFDILQQRLVLVDAIIAENGCKLGDILHYFLDVVVSSSNNGTLIKLRELLDKYDKKIKFCMFEEEVSFLSETGRMTFNSYNDWDLSNKRLLDANLINGDILVFSLNEKDETIKPEIESTIKNLKTRGETYQSNILEFCQYYHSHKKLEIEYGGAKSYRNTILPFINHLRKLYDSEYNEIKCSSCDIINLKIHNNHTFRDLRKQLSYLFGCQYIGNLFFYAPIESYGKRGTKIVRNNELISDYMTIESCKQVLPIKFDFETYTMMEYKKLRRRKNPFGKISCQIARNDWGSPFLKPSKGVIDIIMDVEVPTFTIEILHLLINERIKNEKFQLFTPRIDNALKIEQQQDEKDDKNNENVYLPMVSSVTYNVLKPEYFALITRNIKNHARNGNPCIRQSREIGIVYRQEEIDQLINDHKEDEAEIDNLYDVARYFTKSLRFRVQMYYFEEIIAYELQQLRNEKNEPESESKESLNQVNSICDMLKIRNSNSIIDINRTKIANTNYQFTLKQEIKVANGANKILTHLLIPTWVYFLPNDGKSNFYEGHSLRILISSNENYFDILRLKIYPKLLMSNKENNGNGVNVSFDELMKDDNFYALQPFVLSSIDNREQFESKIISTLSINKSEWKSYHPYQRIINVIKKKSSGQSDKGLLLVGVPNQYFHCDRQISN